MAFVLLGIMTTGCSKNSARSTKDSIGIIGAMDSEVDTLKEATVEKKSTTVAGMEFVERGYERFEKALKEIEAQAEAID